ncbi:hypothetical protein AB0M28_24255 [Streptomyces sp. NPDC051940]|uniref:DUF6928 family protein n=1 Tax=Streptomyces sp. NPDC051940 TaxID=3155675 RepID=UPI00343044F6
MGAKTGLLVYADGVVPDALRQAGAASTERTAAMMRRLHPGWTIEEAPGSTLGHGVYPPDGTAYAASWPGIEIICDRHVMLDYPSRLPEHLVAASAGRRLVLHAMHSVVDWLAFAVWEDGRLIRSLSVSPDRGIMENIGEPLAFELPFWAGERPADVIPWPGEEEEPYSLPFHPLDFGEEALRALCGFVQEGGPDPDDVNAYNVELHGFRIQDPDAPSPAEREAALKRAVAAMGPPRVFTLGPDGSLIERGGL